MKEIQLSFGIGWSFSIIKDTKFIYYTMELMRVTYETKNNLAMQNAMIKYSQYQSRAILRAPTVMA